MTKLIGKIDVFDQPRFKLPIYTLSKIVATDQIVGYDKFLISLTLVRNKNEALSLTLCLLGI